MAPNAPATSGLAILAGDVGQCDALDAGRLEIGGDIRNRFMQRDHERYLAVLFEQSSDVGIDQNDASVREFFARGLGDGVNVAIEPAPERCGNAEPLATQRLRLGHRGAGDDGIQQCHVRDRAAHRTDGVAGVTDRDH